MNLEQIMAMKKELDTKLKEAAASMDRKDSLFNIREQIKLLQNKCPHTGHNFSKENGPCPYCGKMR